MNYKTLVAAPLMSMALTSAAFPDLQIRERNKMRPTSKKVTASAATLFTFAFFVMTAPAVYADEYCVSGGSNSVNSCGYSTMEQCQAASSGRGGMCNRAASAQSAQPPGNALAYQPKQPHSRSVHRSNKEPVGH
jgi:hypothetical protein